MRYFGGKAQDGVYHTIINQIPPHKCYIEAFLGGGAIMRYKRPAEQINVGIELDETAIRYFEEALGDVARFPHLSVLQLDALEFLESGKRYYGPDTFVYCDPPYRMATRSDNRSRYRFEMDDDDHLKLLGIIKTYQCPVMISTYPNDMYTEELKGWRTLEFYSVKSNGSIADEVLFMNYPEPVMLHDYRYIGRDSGNRQDINRRIRRTVHRILGWPKHERIKMLLNFAEAMPADEKKYLMAAGEKTLPDPAGKNDCPAAVIYLAERVKPPAPDPENEVGNESSDG